MLGEKPALPTIMPQTSTRSNLVKLQIFLQTLVQLDNYLRTSAFKEKQKINKQINKIRYSWFKSKSLSKHKVPQDLENQRLKKKRVHFKNLDFLQSLFCLVDCRLAKGV